MTTVVILGAFTIYSISIVFFQPVAEYGGYLLSPMLESVLGMRPEVRVISGDAAAIIQEAVEEDREPTLVAVRHRGLGAVRHFALGSVPSAVLRAVRGSVLIAPPPIHE